MKHLYFDDDPLQSNSLEIHVIVSMMVDFAKELSDSWPVIRFYSKLSIKCSKIQLLR